MRAVAAIAASVVIIGAYLAVAAVFAFSPTWIALGVFAIALGGAVAVVITDRRPADRSTLADPFDFA